MARWIVAFGLAAVALGPRLHAQLPDSATALGVSLTFRRDSLVLRLPASLRPGGALALRTSAVSLARAWVAAARAAADAAGHRQRDTTRVARLTSPLPPPVATEPQDTTVAVGDRGPVLLEEYVDLGLDANLRLELRSERFRNERCTPAEFQIAFSGCEASFPFPSPDPQFNVL